MAESTTSSDQFKDAPAPWACKCTVYWVLSYKWKTLPANSYGPLEAGAPFSSPEAGAFKGGLEAVQVVRYSDSPVGPFNEIVFVPGAFEVPEAVGGKKNQKSIRLTRNYVDSVDACNAGRRNWNMPKHLARFKFSEPVGSKKPLTVEAFHPGAPDSEPFFSVTLKPFRLIPKMPFTTKIANVLGLDFTLVQPPLPAGEAKEPEACGTKSWTSFLPYLHAKKATGCWVKVNKIENGQTEEKSEAASNEPWPAFTPWKAGLWVEDATLEFIVPTILGSNEV